MLTDSLQTFLNSVQVEIMFVVHLKGKYWKFCQETIPIAADKYSVMPICFLYLSD